MEIAGSHRLNLSYESKCSNLHVFQPFEGIRQLKMVVFYKNN